MSSVSVKIWLHEIKLQIKMTVVFQGKKRIPFFLLFSRMTCEYYMYLIFMELIIKILQPIT